MEVFREINVVGDREVVVLPSLLDMASWQAGNNSWPCTGNKAQHHTMNRDMILVPTILYKQHSLKLLTSQRCFLLTRYTW